MFEVEKKAVAKAIKQFDKKLEAADKKTNANAIAEVSTYYGLLERAVNLSMSIDMTIKQTELMDAKTKEATEEDK